MAFGLELHVGQSVANGVLVQLNRAVAEVDVCLVVSEASLNVGDCTVGCVNLLCHTGGAVSAGANFLREGLALAGPLAVRSGSQELLEVVGGAGLVRAEEHLDRQIRQGCVRVGLSQSRVVPVGDGALEDVNNVVNGQVQLINTVDVVGNCNRADNCLLYTSDAADE